MRLNSLYLIALVGVCALVVICFGQSLIDLDIRVIRQKDHVPIEGAIVEVAFEGKSVSEKRTDEKGVVSVPGLSDSRKYRISVRKAGYIRMYEDVLPKSLVTFELIERYAP